MNLLAHAYLGRHSRDLIIGAIAGDFVKGAIPDAFRPAVQMGILLHRKIDTFTDSHPIHSASRQLIHPPYRRYAGILIDLFYDYFLTRHWQQFSDQPLKAFTQSVYMALSNDANNLPSRLATILPRLQQDDRLASYGNVLGIKTALRGIECRLRRPSSLTPAGNLLLRYHTRLEQDFMDFFPVLEEFARRETRLAASTYLPSELTTR